MAFKPIAIGLLIASCAALPQSGQTTSRDIALDILHHAQEQDKTITGHFAGDARIFRSHWNWEDFAPNRVPNWQQYTTMWEQFIVSLNQEVNEFPGLIEIRFTETRGRSRADLDTFIPFIEEEVWGRGALVQTSMQLLNPWTNASQSHRSRNIGNVNDLFDRQTEAGRRFHDALDFHAQAIAMLQERGIPVLFRPYPEDTGGWFWWGSRTLTNEQFQALYRYTHDYFENEKGLDNIVWVYAPSTSNHEMISQRYPGNAYADVVGVSNYNCQPNHREIVTIYNIFQDVAPGKPFAFTEVGGHAERPNQCQNYNRHLKDAIENGDFKLTYFLNWYGPDAMVFYENVQQVFSSSDVLNADDLQRLRDSPN